MNSVSLHIILFPFCDNQCFLQLSCFNFQQKERTFHLESGIHVGHGINVGPGKFVKKNKKNNVGPGKFGKSDYTKCAILC